VADTGFRLGIDFGTSNTVAVLRWPDGRTKSLLFDGSPLLPSAVYVDPTGPILTGRDAVHSARLQPHRFEPYPKRRVEDGTVWLGEREIPVIELVAAVLRRVATEAVRVAGSMPVQVAVTHPAAWAPQRRDTLARATVAAGFPAPSLIAEPVAAASYFVGTVGTHVPVGGYAVVYDFGAGTFDASVVRRDAGGGFDVLASEGLPDAGGLDVDAAVVAYLGKSFEGRDGDRWHRLTQPENEHDRRSAWQLWEDARLAKEMLSRAATTYVHVPLFDESVPVGREQVEELAKPILDRTVTATQLAVTAAGVANTQLSAIFLVGGSSRIPLAATLLHRAFGLAPTAIEQPELVVAEGALYLAPPTGRASVTGGAVSPVSGVPVSGVPVSPVPVSPVPASGVPVSGGPQPAPQPYPVSVARPHPVPQNHAMPQRPPGWQPVSGPPVSPSPIGQFRPPPGASGPYTLPTATSALSHPAYQPGAAPPASGRRRGLVAAGIGGGVLALLLVIAIAVYAIGKAGAGGSGGGGGSPSPMIGAGAGSPACGYKIAYLGVLTGDNAADGVMIRNSGKLAVEQYNDKHSSCQVQLVEYDTQRKDEVSASVARQIADDPKILGVVGPVYRSEMLSAAPVLDQVGLALISPSAADAVLSRSGWKVFHRVLGTDADQASAGAQYLKTVLKTSKTYVVADDTDFGDTGSTEVRRKLGDAAIGSLTIKRADKDFAASIKQITDAGADSVYFAGYFDDGALFVKQLRAANAKIAVVSGDKIFTQSFIDSAGGAAENVVITCPCMPAEQAAQNFASAYKKRFAQTASYYGPEAFDATNIFLSGLATGKATRKAMLAYVDAYEGRGIARTVKFTVNGDLDVKSLDIWAYKVQNGYVVSDQVIPSE
jgi:ABC-type branched-subunit amino acid transport system substrate-binding protein